MNESIKIISGGQNDRVGDLLVNRLLPNNKIFKVGPIVFLDHLYPVVHKSRQPDPYNGQNAHPHRGIATFSYLLSGSLQHLDSRNNRGIVDAGGAQWMKAGNGIIHDEIPAPQFQQTGGVLHALQFWINLPSAIKMEEPEYKGLVSADIPETSLPDDAGTLRVLIGSSGGLRSPFKTFLKEFIFHVRLNPKSSFLYNTQAGLEYAAFIPAEEVVVNGEIAGNSRLLVFTDDASQIRLYNPGITTADAFIFGGAEYTEPIVSQGPFVMNSRLEIAQSYRDFFEGKYGEIVQSSNDKAAV